MLINYFQWIFTYLLILRVGHIGPWSRSLIVMSWLWLSYIEWLYSELFCYILQWLFPQCSVIVDNPTCSSACVGNFCSPSVSSGLLCSAAFSTLYFIRFKQVSSVAPVCSAVLTTLNSYEILAPYIWHFCCCVSMLRK